MLPQYGISTQRSSYAFSHFSPTVSVRYSSRLSIHLACACAAEEITLGAAGTSSSIGVVPCGTRSNVQVPAKNIARTAPKPVTRTLGSLTDGPVWPQQAGMLAHMSSAICLRVFRKSLSSWWSSFRHQVFGTASHACEKA